ncbi:ABC transporter ATP-binding protein [Humitalea sp. 24SJ18S-53]|uniref:ABC transporter ATP-binding protein n=1 Tax=Humitalea sp. 24SJ18S-53 TaxID=3422307 RepID=UPI003D67A467
MSLLAVEDLRVHFVARDLYNRTRVATALNGVSFTLDSGEILGLVGESGAGKSLTTLALLGLLRPPARIAGGSARFAGQELLGLDERALNRIRGTDLTMVVQSPRTSLDPLMRIGDQLTRMQRRRGPVGAAAARQRALEMLEEVGIPDAERRLLAWPHQLSGGMAQRVLMALALVNRPKLLIADEPTTGLDVTVQAQVLDTLRDLVRRRNMGAMMITHDLGVIAHYCDRVAVMFAGTIVEQGPVKQVFRNPAHPYTRALLASTPRRIASTGYRLTGGTPPNLFALPPGCVYQDRCAQRAERCGTLPPGMEVAPGHSAWCHFAERPAA